MRQSQDYSTRSIGDADEDRRPLHDAPIGRDDLPLWNFYYLNTCPPPRDPTIVWGTDVDCTGLQDYLRRVNVQSDVFITPAHLLLAATGRALKEHPEFNRRILRRRVWDYRRINLIMPYATQRERGIGVMFLPDVDHKPLREIAADAWHNTQTAPEAANRLAPYMRMPRWLQSRLQGFHVWLVNSVNLKLGQNNHRQRACSAMVNYLGQHGVAPLRSFKPSRLPYESVSLTVTMGATEVRPAVADGQVVARPTAPLFIRADHRIVDANEIGTFAQTLRTLLADPERIEPLGPPPGERRRQVHPSPHPEQENGQAEARAR